MKKSNVNRNKETVARNKAIWNMKRADLSKENWLKAKKQRGIVDASPAKLDAALKIALPKFLKQKKKNPGKVFGPEDDCIYCHP